jgi:hypothetical protein
MTAENVSVEDFDNVEQTFDILGVTDTEAATLAQVIMNQIMTSNGLISDEVLNSLVGFSLKLFEAKERTGYEFTDDFNSIREELKQRTGRS